MDVLIWCIASLIFMACSFVAGVKYGSRKNATWLVRPHTPETLNRIPRSSDGVDLSTVKEAVFVRTNLPSSTSKME